MFFSVIIFILEEKLIWLVKNVSFTSMGNTFKIFKYRSSNDSIISILLNI